MFHKEKYVKIILSLLNTGNDFPIRIKYFLKSLIEFFR